MKKLSFFLFLFLFQLVFSKENFEEIDSKLVSIVVELPPANGFKSQNFLIHGRQSQSELMGKITEIIKSDFPKIHDFFRYIPQTQVHFVLGHEDIDANGSAAPFPYNIIKLQDFPPIGPSSLINTKDWMRLLLIHEYTHIVTTEMTEGFLDFGRIFLGSTMKWAGLNPRWLLEGLAVWTESQYGNLGDGRLNNLEIHRALVQYFKTSEQCTDFSCWDNPRIYPFGSLAYWLGGNYLAWAEKKYPGLIKCWTHENASDIPFFVNARFRNCTGREIYETYENFKTDYLKVHGQINLCPWKDAKACGELLSLQKTFQIDYFKGYPENSSFALSIINKAQMGKGSVFDNEQIFIFDKLKKQSFFIKPNYLIEEIEPTLESHLFTVTFSTGGWLEGERLFGILDAKTLKIEMLNEQICQENEKDEETQKQRSFFALARVYPLFSEKNRATTFSAWCLGYANQKWLWKFQKNQEESPRTVFEEAPYSLIYRQKMKEDSLTHTTFSLAKDAKDPLEATHVPIERVLVKDITKQNKFEIKNQSEIQNQIQDYSPWKFLYPNFLMLELLTVGDVSSYGLSTSLVDPFMRHDFSLALLYNDPENDTNNDSSSFSGSAIYTYTPGSWNFVMGHQKYLVQFDLPPYQVSSQEVNWIGIGYKWKFNQWKIDSSLKLERRDESDVFASRDIESFQWENSFSYIKNAKNDFFSTFRLSPTLGISRAASRDEYPFFKLEETQLWTWSESFKTQWNFTYGKMYVAKGTGLRQGTFYGGGSTSSLFTTIFDFPSYLINYGNIFGTELFVTRLRQDITLVSLYYGNGLIPFFMKSFGSIFGGEFLSADRVIYDDRIERNKDITSYFVGLNLSTQVFFLLPLDIELVYSHSINDDLAKKNVTLSLVSSLPF